MSVKQKWVDFGYDDDRFELFPEYLTELALSAAIDIDRFLAGKSQGGCVAELEDLLARRVPRTHDDEPNSFYHQVYMPLWRAVRQHSTKDRTYDSFDELALESRLLRYELAGMESLDQERLSRLKKFLLTLSKEYSAERAVMRYGLVG